MSRFPRTLAEAFPVERYPAMFGPYRKPSMLKAMLAYVAFFGLFALLGVIAAWRG